MDEIQRWRLRYELWEACGDVFQDRFAQIMMRLVPGFRRVSQGGGDGGNDGWIAGGDYFQVYAPTWHRYRPTDAIKKLEQDAAKLASVWSPQLEVRRFIYLCKSQQGAHMNLYLRMRELSDRYNFEGDVDDAVTYLERLVDQADPEAQKELAGPPQQAGDRRGDAQAVNEFLMIVRPGIVKLIEELRRSYVSHRTLEAMRWPPLPLAAAANSESIRDIQGRLVTDCIELCKKIDQIKPRLQWVEVQADLQYVFASKIPSSTLDPELATFRDQVEQLLGKIIASSRTLNEFVASMRIPSDRAKL